MEAQGSLGPRVDLVDAVQKRGIQYHQRDDNVIFVKDTVKYVRETIDYKQGVFDAETV